MKRILTIIALALPVLGGCAKFTEPAPVESTLRVVLSPEMGTFKANGKTSTDQAEYEAIVTVYEGTALSSKGWKAEIVDEPSWVDAFQKSVNYTSDFTDIYSGNTYQIKEKGINIALRANRGASRTAILRITVDGGQVFEFKIKQRGEIPDDVFISNVDDLKAWVADQEEWSDADCVYLEGDINMDGVEWEPVNFSGKFDGKGHKIYNFANTVQAKSFGFFATMSGSLSNVVFGSKDGVSHDGISCVNFSGEGGVFHVGGVASVCEGDISNVTSFIDIKIASDCPANIYAAPFVATVKKADITFDGCTNYGNLSAPTADKTTAKETLLGGILARCQPGAGASITVKNCKNYGDIITQDPFCTALGGIVGNCPNGHLVVIDGCENFGNVANNSSASPEGFKEGYAGGIGGLLYGGANSGIVVKNCINHADLTASGTTLGDYGGILGRGRPALIDNCVNEGKVTYDGTGTAQGLLIGGITGGMYQGGTVRGCTNKGEVRSNKLTVHRIGGITGTMSSGTCTVENCVNEAPVSIIRTVDNANWQGIGGICGYQENSDASFIKGCTNKGKITIECPSSTSHANAIGAGGIIGTCKVGTGKEGMSLSGNQNTADVVCRISGSAVNYAGGVAGYMINGVSNGDKSKCAVSGGIAGAVAGFNGGTVTSPSVAGSVNGTAVDASNAASLAVGSSSGSVSGVMFWN